MIVDWFADLPLMSVLILTACSFIGSLLTAALGVGGGAFLITVMAGVLPPLALIPLHGIVQMGSNASRLVHTHRHLQSPVISYFALGAVLASLVAIYLLGVIDPAIIPLFVALFILWLTWGPMPAIGLGKNPLGLFIGGLLTTLATMIVGATGPLVSAWLGRIGVDKWVYTANFSACMTLQHLLKIAVFGFAGFAFLAWIPLLLLMLVAGYAGTRVGLVILGKLPEAKFKTVFKWVLTVLAGRVLWLWWVS